MNKAPKYNLEAAEAVAVQALGFLVEDDHRLQRFLALSGLDPSQIRAAATAPGFLAGVLDHIVADDRLLIAFAEQSGLAPADIEKGHAALTGGGEYLRSI
jgi:hypothetical protein